MSLAPRGKMYEALTSTNVSVVYVTVTGFVEKKAKYWFPDYLFVLEVFWTNKQTTFVKRSYNDILTLHDQIRAYFSERFERGQTKSTVFIPRLEGRRIFKHNSIELAEQREVELQTFFRELIGGNPLISGNKLLVDFFIRRPTDPLPCDSPAMTNIDDDEDEDEVLFDR